MNIELDASARAKSTRAIRIVAVAAACMMPVHYAAADTTAPKPDASLRAVAPDTKAPAATDGSAQQAFKSEKEKVSYAMGMTFATQLHLQPTVDLDVFMQGLKDAVAGGKTLLTDQEARAVVSDLHKELNNRRARLIEEQQKSKQAGEAFLAANKTKAGVITQPSGLQYKIVKHGFGKRPSINDTVICNYRATLVDGTEVDSSYKRKQPMTFPVKKVIKGWAEALQLMPVGSKWDLFIPASLAYGPRGAGNGIGPDTALIFEVELVAIKSTSQDKTSMQDTKGAASSDNSKG
jgi:FKBP-type peptidyl-prolyl cis-trans isomerase FklB